MLLNFKKIYNFKKRYFFLRGKYSCREMVMWQDERFRYLVPGELLFLPNNIPNCLFSLLNCCWKQEVRNLTLMMRKDKDMPTRRQASGFCSVADPKPHITAFALFEARGFTSTC